MGILHGNQNMVIGGLVLYLDSINPNSWPPGSATGVVSAGQTSYTTPGTYEFEVPTGITQISAVCIGGGGAGGGYSQFAQGGGGGGGGGMSWGTISVSPGDDLEVVVGEGGECPESDSTGGDGGDSQLIWEANGGVLLQGGGAEGGDAGAVGGEGGTGGTSTGTMRDGGGTGGAGGDEDGDNGGGGGGAAGYEGNGGSGATTGADEEGANGSGGGGGGGSHGTYYGGDGGGVGFLGEHSPMDNGTGGTGGNDGEGGSGGESLPNQGYGGGGGGANKANGFSGSDGRDGAVRIVYKKDDNTRVYPLKSNADDTTYNTGDTTWKYVVSNGIEVDQYATLHGGVTRSNDVFDFDGIDDYVELSGTSSLNYPMTTSVTLSVFVKFDTVGDWAGLLTKNQSTSTRLALLLKNTNVATFTATSGTQLEGSTTLTTGKWYNIVGVQLSGISRKLYINGVLDGTSTSDFGTTPAGSENWMIGQATGVSMWLDGQIANATIYNKALTAAEVLQNYNAHKGRFGL